MWLRSNVKRSITKRAEVSSASLRGLYSSTARAREQRRVSLPFGAHPCAPHCWRPNRFAFLHAIWPQPLDPPLLPAPSLAVSGRSSGDGMRILSTQLTPHFRNTFLGVFEVGRSEWNHESEGVLHRVWRPAPLCLPRRSSERAQAGLRARPELLGANPGGSGELLTKFPLCRLGCAGSLSDSLQSELGIYQSKIWSNQFFFCCGLGGAVGLGRHVGSEGLRYREGVLLV